MAKKMISASSKPTTITAGDNHIEVTKNETDSDITFTLKQKSNSYTANVTYAASSQGILNFAKGAVPDNVNDAWVSGTCMCNLAKLKNCEPLYSDATGTLTGTYKAHLINNFVSAEIYDTDGLFAVAYTPTTNFRSLTDLAFNGTRVTDFANGLPKKSVNISFTWSSNIKCTWNRTTAATYGGLSVYTLSLNLVALAQINAGSTELGTANINNPNRLFGPAISYADGIDKSFEIFQWEGTALSLRSKNTIPKNNNILISSCIVIPA